MLNREQDINGAVKRLFACIIFFVDEKKHKENGTYEAKSAISVVSPTFVLSLGFQC